MTPLPLPASSSSSSDEAVAGPLTAVPQDDFRAHQELLKSAASNLGLQAEELKEPTDAVFDTLAAAAPSKFALPVHEGVVKLVKALWQTLSSLPLISKRAEKKYCVPAKVLGYLYLHPFTGSLVVSTVERDRQEQASSTPKNKDAKNKSSRNKSLFDCQPATAHVSPARTINYGSPRPGVQTRSPDRNLQPCWTRAKQ